MSLVGQSLRARFASGPPDVRFLIGHLGSSTFRLATMPVSIALNSDQNICSAAIGRYGPNSRPAKWYKPKTKTRMAAINGRREPSIPRRSSPQRVS